MANKKTAIVTGGAGGIGRAFVQRLLTRGYQVVIADLDEELGSKAQDELGEAVLFIRCDVSNWDSQASMFEKAYEWGGRIDLLVANAGIEEGEHFYVLPSASAKPARPNTAVIDVNLYSVIYGLRLFRYYTLRGGEKEGYSRILVTNSLAGFYPFPAAPVYSAAKHALVGLVRSTAFKLHRDERILINAVSPGPVDTKISEITKKFVPIEKFTPMELLVESLDKVLDEDMTGQVIECSNVGISIREFPDYSNENAKELIEDMKRF